MLHVHKLTTRRAEHWDWPDLIAAEPRLERLYTDVCRLRDPGGLCFCAEAIWHRQMKARLTHLVGFQASDPELRSMGAYDVAFEKIYGAMPACRGCACVAS
jgi:hypothetical protein